MYLARGKVVLLLFRRSERRRGTSRVREALKVCAAAGVRVPNPLLTCVRVVLLLGEY